MSERPDSRSLGKFAITIATAVLLVIVVELIASFALLMSLRLANSEKFTQTEPTYFSLINLPYRVGVSIGLFNGMQVYRTEIYPKEFTLPDPELGYRPKPGKFLVTYSRRVGVSDDWEHFRVKHTQNADGTRWTGDPGADYSSTVYIFGDSYVAGTGVNDEQTFSYLLQQARNDLRVRLFAVGGYGTTQAFILFNQLRDQIKPNDIIIIGYANFYDVRNVVAPSRLRAVEAWFQTRLGQPPDAVLLPKATIDDRGVIRISHVQQRCSENEGYCELNDPPMSEMNRVTAALVNYIAENTEAKIFLLHIEGANTPLFDLLDDSVIKVSARPEDFDYFIRDDVEGFDPHPGPYWHYAVSRKLLEALDGQCAAKVNSDTVCAFSDHDSPLKETTPGGSKP